MRLSRLAQACDCDFSVGSTSKPSFKCSARRPADARIDWTPEIGVVVMAGLPVLAVVVVVAVGGEDEVAVNVVSRSGVECCDGVVWSILALFVGKPSYFGEKIMVTATCLFLHCEVHGCALSFDLLWSFFGLDHHTNKTFCQPQCPFEISTSSPGAGPQLPVHNCQLLGRRPALGKNASAVCRPCRYDLLPGSVRLSLYFRILFFFFFFL